MTEKSLSIKGVEWRYATGGRGRETILLLHDTFGGAETLETLAGRFADEYRTIAPTIADARSLEEVCDAVSAILDREHVGRATVFGVSFGGFVAQAFLKRRAHQVEHLVLISTSLPDRKAAARTESTSKFIRLLPFRLTRSLMKLDIHKSLEAPAPPDVAARLAVFKQQLDEYFDHKLTKATLLARVRLSVDFNRNETYNPADNTDWPGRVLIIESNDDPVVPANERKRLREAYPRALVCTFTGAGHSIPLLLPDELVGVVKAFLKEDYKTPAELEQCLAAEAHEHTDECGIMHTD